MTTSLHITPTFRSIRRVLVAAAVTAACVASCAGVASASSLHAASAFKPKGIYDCSVLQAFTGIRVYVTTLEFKSHHKYSNGLRGHGNALSGSVSKGSYKVVGSKIIPLSGRLKKLHESLLVQAADLAVMDSKGHFTSLGCYLRSSGSSATPTTPPSTPPPGTPKFPLGNYTCYHTVRQPNGSVDSQFLTTVFFWNDGTYLTQGSIRGGAWSQDGNTINFTAGSNWSDIGYRHDVGTWVPAGVAMPSASGSMTGNQYTFVIRSTRPNELNPPMSEFAGSYPESFDYCKQ